MIKEAQYIGSYVKLRDCPQSMIPEYAFVGRSNVGKSSLINMLTQHKGLAKVSVTPGKTQTINFFKINRGVWHLVDVPGYGYAKVSKTRRAKWEQMIKKYLLNRHQLMAVFLLLDARIAFQSIDELFINWMGEAGIPFSIVFTKLDKRHKSKCLKNIEQIKRKMLEKWDVLPSVFETSSADRIGGEAILNFVDTCNHTFFDINKQKR